MSLTREQYEEYRRNFPARKSARRMGWMSVGLGVAQLCLAAPMARTLGLPSAAGMLLRMCGMRELATGAGLLLTDKPEPWMKARVAGDALDLGCLGLAAQFGNKPLNAVLAAGSVAGIAAMDWKCSKGLETEHQPHKVYDYSDRSGFPKPASQMRGIATSEKDRGQSGADLGENAELVTPKAPPDPGELV
ncbi:MAG: transcriptional regulator [Halopseudomonas sp.]|uniref:transcriptional regulator n=1 Tax=Halopseudomonas sp. TaxID=2901191 RepID=UPI0030017956